MTDLRKAAEMALEALETFKLAQNPIVPQSIYVLRQALAQPTRNAADFLAEKQGAFRDPWINIMKFYKPAHVLAQPEQKPVAWLYNGHLHECDPSDWAESEVKPLYTAPPSKPWVSLTDEEIEVIAKRLMDDKTYCSLHFAVAIGAALRSKNT